MFNYEQRELLNYSVRKAAFFEPYRTSGIFHDLVYSGFPVESELSLTWEIG